MNMSAIRFIPKYNKKRDPLTLENLIAVEIYQFAEVTHGQLEGLEVKIDGLIRILGVVAGQMTPAQQVKIAELLNYKRID